MAVTTSAAVPAKASESYPWMLIGLLWVVAFLNAADRNILIAVLPDLKSEFGLTNSQLALLGSVFFWVYAVGAFMVLYSTYFVSAASNGRLFVDVTGLLGVIKYSEPADRARILRFAVIGIPVFTLGLVLTAGNPVTLVLIGGTAQGFMIPFLGFAAVWFGRQVHPSIRGGKAWSAALIVSFVLMSALGLFNARAEILKLIARFSS